MDIRCINDEAQYVAITTDSEPDAKMQKTGKAASPQSKFNLFKPATPTLDSDGALELGQGLVC